MPHMTPRKIVLATVLTLIGSNASAGCDDIDVDVFGDGNNVQINCADKAQTNQAQPGPVIANFCIARNIYGQGAVWEKFNPSVRLAPGMFCTFSPIAVMTYGYTVGIAQ